MSGKDQAITALSQSLMQKAQEHEKMSEMLSQFKNRLIYENCFHVNYGARLVKKTVMIKSFDEVTISFLRDQSFEEEFFCVIENKDFNPKTGVKDKRLIAVDDIDCFVHVKELEF